LSDDLVGLGVMKRHGGLQLDECVKRKTGVRSFRNLHAAAPISRNPRSIALLAESNRKLFRIRIASCTITISFCNILPENRAAPASAPFAPGPAQVAQREGPDSLIASRSGQPFTH